MKKIIATMVAFMVPAILYAGEISVQGIGVEQSTPDVAYITAGVTTKDVDLGTAVKENNKKMQNLFDNLKKQELKDDEIKTVNFSVTPVYTYDKEQILDGFRASNLVRITVCDFDKIQEILSVCVESGATNIGNISFDIADKSVLLEKARKKAYEDAVQKMKTFCEVGKLKYVSLKALSENSYSGGFSPTYRAEGMDVGSQPPISGGQHEVRVTIDVVFEVEESKPARLSEVFPTK